MLKNIQIIKEFISTEITSKYKLPTPEDELDDIVNTIFRLEDTYLIKPIEIANGELSTLYPSQKLDGT